MESLVGILGRECMKPADLLKEIHKAGWPESVMLGPDDFFALTLTMGIAPERYESGQPYFWVGRTRVVVLNAPPGFVNLVNWKPPIIELAR